jgi:hypothetical protein
MSMAIKSMSKNKPLPTYAVKLETFIILYKRGSFKFTVKNPDFLHAFSYVEK